MRNKTCNFVKFQTRNPVVRRLFTGFYTEIAAAVEKAKPSSIIDAGCGEGETLERLRPLLPREVSGFDLNGDSVEFAVQRLPGYRFSQRDIYDTGLDDGAADMVLCLEVLEHLEEPDRAVRELNRIARKNLLLSVPHEPWFQLGSLLRGNYVSSLGNHPEHINHWNPRSFMAFLDPLVDVMEVRTAFPWVIALCARRNHHP